MPDRNRPAEIRAAGAVLWRPGTSGPEVALVHRPRYDDWSFAKGKSSPGEHVLLTAVREVAEETGIRVFLGRRLSSARYHSGSQFKRVDYWAARPATDGHAPAGFVPNAEVDALAWLPEGAARDRLSYPHDEKVLDEFASAPVATCAFILIRHATARLKTAWRNAGNPDDLTRPLTAYGRDQAERLATLLECFGPARVISSAAQRCVATVEPYAALTGARVEAEPTFGLAPAGGTGAWAEAEQRIRVARHHSRARRRIGELAVAGHPVVICAHRENLPSLLGWACERLGAPVPHGPPLPKGAFWVLHIGAGRLVSAEQHHLMP